MFLLLTPVQSAVETSAAPKKNDPALRTLSVSPSSTSLAGGKARLILTSLTRQGGTYIGDYQIKVTPYFFKSEKGTLAMIISDQSLAKLTQNVPVEFLGKATTNGSKKTRRITVRAAPSAKLRGALKISVATENGALVFDTTYRFGGQ